MSFPKLGCEGTTIFNNRKRTDPVKSKFNVASQKVSNAPPSEWISHEDQRSEYGTAPVQNRRTRDALN